jgi:hypothetical protein
MEKKAKIEETKKKEVVFQKFFELPEPIQAQILSFPDILDVVRFTQTSPSNTAKILALFRMCGSFLLSGDLGEPGQRTIRHVLDNHPTPARVRVLTFSHIDQDEDYLLRIDKFINLQVLEIREPSHEEEEEANLDFPELPQSLEQIIVTEENDEKQGGDDANDQMWVWAFHSGLPFNKLEYLQWERFRVPLSVDHFRTFLDRKMFPNLQTVLMYVHWSLNGLLKKLTKNCPLLKRLRLVDPHEEAPDDGKSFEQKELFDVFQNCPNLVNVQLFRGEPVESSSFYWKLFRGTSKGEEEDEKKGGQSWTFQHSNNFGNSDDEQKQDVIHEEQFWWLIASAKHHFALVKLYTLGIHFEDLLKELIQKAEEYSWTIDVLHIGDIYNAQIPNRTLVEDSRTFSNLFQVLKLKRMVIQDVTHDPDDGAGCESFTLDVVDEKTKGLRLSVDDKIFPSTCQTLRAAGFHFRDVLDDERHARIAIEDVKEAFLDQKEPIQILQLNLRYGSTWEATDTFIKQLNESSTSQGLIELKLDGVRPTPFLFASLSDRKIYPKLVRLPIYFAMDDHKSDEIFGNLQLAAFSGFFEIEFTTYSWLQNKLKLSKEAIAKFCQNNQNLRKLDLSAFDQPFDPEILQTSPSYPFKLPNVEALTFRCNGPILAFEDLLFLLIGCPKLLQKTDQFWGRLSIREPGILRPDNTTDFVLKTNQTGFPVKMWTKDIEFPSNWSHIGARYIAFRQDPPANLRHSFVLMASDFLGPPSEKMDTKKEPSTSRGVTNRFGMLLPGKRQLTSGGPLYDPPYDPQQLTTKEGIQNAYNHFYDDLVKELIQKSISENFASPRKKLIETLALKLAAQPPVLFQPLRVFANDMVFLDRSKVKLSKAFDVPPIKSRLQTLLGASLVFEPL